MPEYELRLRFIAANADQADRLAEAWAGTCAAEYGTRYAGCRETSTEPPGLSAVPNGTVNPVQVQTWGKPTPLTAPPHCDWCGTAIFPDFENNWHDRHGDFHCPEVSEDHTDHVHEPAGGMSQ